MSSGISNVVGIPSKVCKTSFDAAGFINGEMVIFKNEYFWQPAKSNELMKTQSVWPELPVNGSQIDVVYETDDERVWFFIGQEIYIYNNFTLVQRTTLENIGIPMRNNSRVQLMFKWPCSGDTFIIYDDEFFQHLYGTQVMHRTAIRDNSTKPRYDLNNRSLTFFTYGETMYRLKGVKYETWCPRNDPHCLGIGQDKIYDLHSELFANCTRIE